MKSKAIVYLIISLILTSLFIPTIVGDSLNSCNNKIEFNNPILQFYFDEVTKRLYLKNIGDEIAYKVTLLVEVEGFIILGFGNNLTVGIDSLNPDE